MKKIAAFAAAGVLIFFLGSCSLFGPFYSLTLVIEGEAGGKITTSSARDEYSANTIVELSAEAEAGWVFKSWSGVTTDDGNTATVLMNMNRRVSALFEPVLKSENPSDGVIIPPSADFAPSSEDSWTFMVYMDADNNLDAYSLLDINEMEKGLALSGNDNIEIIVLHDRWSDGSGWSDTRLYSIVPDSTDAIVSGTVYERLYPDEVELNMGDPDVLSDFLVYCKNNFEANHYALILWNHGGGARSIDSSPIAPAGRGTSSRLICQDEDTGEAAGTDYLFTDELQQALETASSDAAHPIRPDVIGVDACVMGTVEAAYELRQLTDCYVASMADININGWSYDDLFGRMEPESGGAGAEDLAALMVDSFRNSAPLTPVPTLSAVRTSGLSSLKSSIDHLAAELYASDSKAAIELIRDSAVDFFNDDYDAEAIARPYHDLNDLCTYIINNKQYISDAAASAAGDVIEQLELTVISAYAGPGLGNYYGSGTSVKRGLSIFFSKGNLEYNNASQYACQYWYTDQDSSEYGAYGYLDFCNSDSDGIVETWRELHEAWYDPYRPDGYTPGSW